MRTESGVGVVKSRTTSPATPPCAVPPVCVEESTSKGITTSPSDLPVSKTLKSSVRAKPCDIAPSVKAPAGPVML